MKKIALALTVALGYLSAHEIIIQTPHDTWHFEHENESIQEVIDFLGPYVDPKANITILIDSAHPTTTPASLGSALVLRDYEKEVSPNEKKDLYYIVTTLANRSPVAIALSKVELESAGSRIAHLHPLRFLMTVFSDEELKVGIKNIRGKGWVWNQFTLGLKEALSAEYAKNNLRIDQVSHFAAQVGIQTELIWGSIRQQDWDLLVDLLITHIPRKGRHDRYDM